MVDIAATLIHWYAENKRELPWRETTDPYRIWISEIILQQTRVVQGLEYFNRFMLRFPDVRALAEAPGDEVIPRMRCRTRAADRDFGADNRVYRPAPQYYSR